MGSSLDSVTQTYDDLRALGGAGPYMDQYGEKLNNSNPNAPAKEIMKNLKISVAKKKKKKGISSLFSSPDENTRTPDSPVIVATDFPDGTKGYRFNVMKDLGKIHESENYEKIPVLVLHHIFLNLLPKDLVSVFLSCKYFYKFANSNIFWRSYYKSYFSITEKQAREDLSYDKPDDLNWKKNFFKRFSECKCANLYYRKTQEPQFREIQGEELINNIGFGGLTDQRDGKIYFEQPGVLICGPEGVGKKSIVLRLLKNKFFEDTSKIKLPRVRMFTKSRFYYQRTMDETEESQPYREVAVRSGVEEGEEEEEEESNYFTPGNFLFCFEADNKDSFLAVKKFVDFYSQQMMMGLPNKKRRRFGILVGTKSDGLPNNEKVRKFAVSEIKEYMDMKMLKGYCEVSAKDNTSCYLPFGILNEKKFYARRMIQM